MDVVNEAGKSVVIIGAGIAGLATGCYLQMNGYKTKILEMYTMPGGCCTAWDIKNYRCDYCIDWMPGCGDLTDSFTRIWRELGALQGKKIVHFDIFNSIVCDDGTRVNFYVDPERLERHLLEISPEDNKLIKVFCDDLKQFIKFVDVYAEMVLKPHQMLTFLERVRQFFKLLPYTRVFMRTGSIQMLDFANKFKSPALRQAMNCIFYTRYDGLPVLPFLINIAYLSRQLGGCPEGGSMALSASIAQRYADLGGEIIYDQKVDKILVHNDQVTGVRNTVSVEYHADYVVSAMDGYQTLKHLLDDKYTTSTLTTLYDAAINRPAGIVFQGVLTLFIGVGVDLTDEIHSTTYFLTDEEMRFLPGVSDNSLSVHVRSNMYSNIAPAGKSVVKLACLSDYRAWEKLDSEEGDGKSPPKTHTARKRTRAYRDAKKEVVEVLSKRFKQLYPKAADKIEMMDVSTPLTMIRYTGALGGALLGWVPFAKEVEQFENDTKKYGPRLPDLKNFYMAGQWVQGGGLITTASSGRHAAQYICHQDGKKFITSES